MTSGPHAERRRGERRAAGRPVTVAAGSAESWLSALVEPGPRAADAGLHHLADEGPPDEPFFAREARRLVLTEGAALPRILRTYVIARVALGVALMLAPWAAALMGSPPSLLVLLISLVYASQAVSMWVLRGTQQGSRQAPGQLLPQQWVWTIGVDVVAFSMLRLLDPAGQLNYAALLVLPVLMAGVLTRRTVALATTAAVVLVLLGGVWLASGGIGDALLPLSQAGLAGAGMFVITLLASELAQRLAGEEHSARSNLALARQQSQLNHLVIEEMADGVLVVDRHGLVRALNPAGLNLLGGWQDLAPQRPLSASPGLAPLQQALQRAYLEGRWPDDARELVVHTAEGRLRTLQVRARFTRRAGMAADGAGAEDICVLFLEDLRVVQDRLRQDKLAAMGRMSAGIAHEIRNPLAAIAQANALLLEDVLMPPQRRLARIVGDNVERLKRIVDDVLTVAAVPSPQDLALDLPSTVRQVCDDWRRGLPPELRQTGRLALDLPDSPASAHFDHEHLRRVLVNLLDNAHRHALPGAGAVLVSVVVPVLADAPLGLSVASDGEPIPPDTERHLFEPFFSTRSRGSGLGLYICRELCARHGASIDYLPGPPGARHRNVFRVMMRRAAAASS